MVAEELRSKLTGLHQLLGASPALDAESRTLLRTVLHDIERVLDRPDAGVAPGEAAGVDTTSAAAAQPASTADRLETLATRFEADHPAITGVLRQLTDLLAKAGI